MQSGNSRFLVVQLEGTKAANCNLGIRDFWVAGLVKRRQGCKLQSRNSRFFRGRSGWKATGLLLQSGNSRFFGSQVELENDRTTTVI